MITSLIKLLKFEPLNFDYMELRECLKRLVLYLTFIFLAVLEKMKYMSKGEQKRLKVMIVFMIYSDKGCKGRITYTPYKVL